MALVKVSETWKVSTHKKKKKIQNANFKLVKLYTVWVRAPHHDDHNADHPACLNYTHDHNHRDDLPCARTHTVIASLITSLNWVSKGQLKPHLKHHSTSPRAEKTTTTQNRKHTQIQVQHAFSYTNTPKRKLTHPLYFNLSLVYTHQTWELPKKQEEKMLLIRQELATIHNFPFLQRGTVTVKYGHGYTVWTVKR